MSSKTLYQNVRKAKDQMPLAASASKEAKYVAEATYQNNMVITNKSSVDCCYTEEDNVGYSQHHILLTREELAARWKYCVETLKRWEKAGKLPFLVLGKEIRYRLSAIVEIEANSEVPV